MSITLLSVCSGSSMALRQSYKKNAIIFFFRQNLSFPNINHRFMRRSKSCKKTGRRGSGSSVRFPECFPERCGVVLRGGNPAKPSVTLYFFRQGVGRKFFCCQIARKGPKTTPFTKNIAHARAILSPKVARIARNYYFCSLFGGLYRGAADAPTPTRERNRFYRRDRCLQKKKRMPVWWGVLSPSISKSR